MIEDHLNYRLKVVKIKFSKVFDRNLNLFIKIINFIKNHDRFFSLY